MTFQKFKFIPIQTLRFKFIIYLGSVLSVSIGVIFYAMFLQSKSNSYNQLERQARVLLQQVIITRMWVADHGGLFFRQLEGVEENPWLPGTKVLDHKGKSYVFRNPAMVTREISEYAEKVGLYRFKLTSMNFKNPDNKPTEFEKKGLILFQQEGYEKWKDGISIVNLQEGSPLYQRIVPLRVKTPCLDCHADQEYEVGDIGGGLSVIIPIDETVNAINRSRHTFLLASVLIISLVLGMVYLMLQKMVLKPVDSLRIVAERLIAGEYSIQAQVKTGDEMESFSHAFNKMTFQLKKGYEGTIKALVAAMEARDPYTKGHTERVARYSKEIATEMGFTEEELDELDLGATLHDIGKIGISDLLLNKTDPLNATERQIMEKHVKEGEKIINDAHFLVSALPAILYHHERLDGKGYPLGIHGDDLPIVARIIAVADTFDAMTTDRPYRKALPPEKALEEIEKNAGTQFDPDVVTTFQNVFRAGKKGQFD